MQSWTFHFSCLALIVSLSTPEHLGAADSNPAQNPLAGNQNELDSRAEMLRLKIEIPEAGLEALKTALRALWLLAPKRFQPSRAGQNFV